MRTVKIVLVAIFLATTAVSAQDAQKNKKEEQIVFSVSMDCHNCEQKVMKNIPYERGVKDLNTNLENKLVTIRYKTKKTNKDNLKKAIEKLGFTCEEVKPDAQK